LDKGFVCWSVSIPLGPPPLRIRVYKSPVLYGAGTPNLVWHLGALRIDATLSECQISQHHHENHRPDNYPKHDFLPALLRKSITAASERHRTTYGTKVALCVTANLGRRCPLRVYRVISGPASDFRFPSGSGRIAAPHRVTKRAISGHGAASHEPIPI
jgi:hypothetical protein